MRLPRSSLILFLMYACGGARAPAPTEAGAGASGCSRDEQCLQGFCDSTGRCGTASYELGYGIPCQIPSLDLPGETRAKLDVCGAYRCKAERCRSCMSDDECLGEGESADSGTTCSPLGFVSDRPGRRCGRYGP